MKFLLSACLTLVITVLGLPSQGLTSPITYLAQLDGASEFPFPTPSPGTGSAKVSIDLLAHTLHVQVIFSGLVAGNTAAHIHAPTEVPFIGGAGVATTVPTFTGFPTGATSGTYDHFFDLTQPSSWNPAFVTSQGGTLTGAEAALAVFLASGRAYVNIHSSEYPGGEIRGFLVAPAPATLLLLGTGLACLAGTRLRRKK